MNIPVKTLKSGFSLPVYGLGTWRKDGLYDLQADAKNIHSALGRGITHIDTAESYGMGEGERAVGEAIKEHDRKKLTIVTKVSAINQAYDDLLRSFEASLKQLDTEYIDVYLLHRFPIPGIDIVDTMRAMDRLVDEGVVKNIGVSNMSINRFKEAQKHTKNKLVCNQLEFNLAQRAVQNNGLLDFCKTDDVFLTAWAPLALGNLGGNELLSEIAKKYDKTPYQVALNWLIVQDNVITIPKTSSLEHLDENLGALGWELADEDVERLSNEFPNQTTRSDRVPLDYAADVPA